MKRIEEIDIMRGIAMLMVVVGHTSCPQLVHGLFSYVHIPLFFMLSGCTNRPDYYYYKFSNIKEFVLKRIKSLYLPFLSFALLIVILHNFFYSLDIYEKAYTLGDFFSQIVRTTLFSIGTNEPMLIPLWFMKSLFLCEISYALFVYISNKWSINKWIVICPIIIPALLIKGVYSASVLESNVFWPLAAVVFYILGGAILRNINALIRYKNWIVVGFLISWFFFSFYYPRYYQIASGVFSIIQVLLSIGAFISAWVLIQMINNVFVIKKVLTYIGNNTIPIYFQHIMWFYIISLVASILLFPDSYHIIRTNVFIPEINWGIYAIISTLLCLIMHYLYKKMLSAIKRILVD